MKRIFSAFVLVIVTATMVVGADTPPPPRVIRYPSPPIHKPTDNVVTDNAVNRAK